MTPTDRNPQREEHSMVIHSVTEAGFEVRDRRPA